MKPQTNTGYTAVQRVAVPEHSIDDAEGREWRIEHFEIDEEGASLHNLQALFSREHGRDVKTGIYTRLAGPGGGPWMSDTPAELRDHQALFSEIDRRGGAVLLHGLGIGMALTYALRHDREGKQVCAYCTRERKPRQRVCHDCRAESSRSWGVLPQRWKTWARVTSIDVVEIEQAVIDLVGPHYQRLAAEAGIELNLICADALTHAWPKGQRWSAVWHDIWPTVSAGNAETMSTLHRRFARRADWQSSWCRSWVKSMQRGEW